jgi:hypothetical protein
MPTFADWFARSPLASAARVFAAVVLTLAVTQWTTNGAIDFGAWQLWLIAGCASVLPTLTRWLNPEDFEFGRGATTVEPFDLWDEED